MTFERVLVVGAGQMGAGIAQVVAASGRHVLLHDPFPGAVERGLGAMRASLEKLEQKALRRGTCSGASRLWTHSSPPT